MQKFGGLVLALFCVLFLCSCAKAVPEQQVEEEREEHAIGEVAAQEQAAPTMEDRLAAQLRTMTIEEKIAHCEYLLRLSAEPEVNKVKMMCCFMY